MNVDRLRAKHALQAVQGLPTEVKKYTSYAKGLPASILQNGLGQAMATLLAAAKGEPAFRDGAVHEAHRLLYDHVQDWLCRSDPLAPYQTERGPGSNSTILMEKIVENGEADYLWAQAEALAYLSWLKKFAVAFRSEKGGNP